ncbi:hypothetical protein [uncultured Photobacterium sp.]|uniref:hypothetical protein n=1 Tax=uncultured Photobacterium sp. TaxID=173973 RepID=UPI002624EAFC|nr:hypothetical protein [uncultured Photobacterium sp.]
MSEYFFVVESTSMPYYVFPEKYAEVLPSPIFVYPQEPIPLFADIKPDVDYKVQDFIKFPGISFSERVCENAGLQYIYGVNWAPVVINDSREYNFYMAQVANRIECIDLNRSEYKKVSRSGRISGLNKVVLDDDKLNKIPENRRLMFVCKGWGAVLFHHSLVEKIMRVEPMGLEFISVDDYTKGMF